MKKAIIIYDDTINVPENIKTIIGQVSFGEIILRGKTIFNRLKDIAKQTNEQIEIKQIKDIKEYTKNIKKDNEETIILHMFSNFAIANGKEFKTLLKKIYSVNENYKIVQNKDIVAIVFNNIEEYKQMLEQYIKTNIIKDIYKYKTIKTKAFIDISNYNKLLKYISNMFDTRYFNNIEDNEITITKKSENKDKIKREYMYYQLLPIKMKKWMVMPYNYKENEKTAQYTMQKMPMTDIAFRWTHNAIDEKEYTNILNKIFYYIDNREKKNVSKENYQNIENELYIEKVQQRIKDLKNNQLFNKIDTNIKRGTKFNSIDEIYEYYVTKYNKYLNKNKKYISVIGHGDLCFSNILYSKEQNLLRLIDPKGALTKEELWTNPYYDVAKLAHSICGNYDFFNSGSYSIALNNNSKYELKIYNNNEKYKEIFKQYLEKNNFDYTLVKVYEASLFLSMLPLHMDRPHKVFGFLLNAINILDEI